MLHSILLRHNAFYLQALHASQFDIKQFPLFLIFSKVLYEWAKDMVALYGDIEMAYEENTPFDTVCVNFKGGLYAWYKGKLCHLGRLFFIY